jgi:hypothetical protein
MQLALKDPAEIVGQFCKITPTGVEWLRETTEEEEVAFCDFAFALYNASPWIVGDAALKMVPDDDGPGKSKNEKLEELAEKYGLSYRTIYRYRQISKLFDLTRRLANLSFSHHLEIYACGVDESWLTTAVENNWSSTTMREQIQASKLPPPEPEKPKTKRKTQEGPHVGSGFESDPPGPTQKELELMEADGGGHVRHTTAPRDRDHSWANQNILEAVNRLHQAVELCLELDEEIWQETIDKVEGIYRRVTQ